MKKSPAGNTGLAKVAVQCSADTFVVNQSLVLRINICGEIRHLRQARNRYRKPYGDSANIKQSDMKRTLLNDITELLAHRPTSQRHEVLFLATAQNTLSFFCNASKPTTKNQRVFSPSLLKQLHSKQYH